MKFSLLDDPFWCGILENCTRTAHIELLKWSMPTNQVHTRVALLYTWHETTTTLLSFDTWENIQFKFIKLLIFLLSQLYLCQLDWSWNAGDFKWTMLKMSKVKLNITLHAMVPLLNHSYEILNQERNLKKRTSFKYFFSLYRESLWSQRRLIVFIHFPYTNFLAVYYHSRS